MESPDAPIKFGRYELLRLLARGGMGEVYLARMQGASGWQKQLVIKRMLPHLAEDPAFARRFLEEARISTSLSHGNLVPVFDVGEHDGALFLAMDHVDGWDLRAIHRAELARGARLPDQLALFIIAEICRGLAYVHNRRDDQGRRLGLVHRDVSPSNILISRDGEAKLVDFGIAIAPDQAVRTATGELRGKLAYMSPEQARGERLDHRSDIYSLGVVLYELLTGERPVSTGSDMEVLARVQRGEHRPITDLRDDLPAGLAQLVERAIATSPDDRFEEVDELLLGLMRLLFSETGPVTHALLARHVGRLMAEPAPTSGMSLNDLLNAQLDEAAQSQSGARHLTPSRPTGSDRSARSAPPSSPRLDAASITRTRAVRPAPSPARSRLWFAVIALALVTLGLTPFLWPRLTRAPLQVTSEPAGAAVYWNDELVGRTPLDTRVRQTTGLLRLEKKGFVASEQQIDLPTETTVSVGLAAEPISLLFQSTPPGAAVRIDGGPAFPAGTPALLLPDSEHTVTMELAGYKSLSERHRVTAGETLFARLLEPLPAAPAAAPEATTDAAPITPPAQPGDGLPDKMRPAAPAPAPGRFTFRFIEPPLLGTLSIDGGPPIQLIELAQVVEIPAGDRTLTIRSKRDGRIDSWVGKVAPGQQEQVRIDWK